MLLRSDPAPAALRRKLAWIVLLYFAEGFPFGVVYDLLPVYFRTSGVSLRQIGLLSLLGLPWSLKVIWSPLVDRFGDRRTWIAACLFGMGVILLVLPAFPPARIGWALRGVLLAFTVFAATQDIAIDAYTIGLFSRGQEGPANSARVSAYRAAIVVGGGGLVALAAFLPWRELIWTGAGLCLLLSMAATRTPAVPISAESRREVFRPLWVWLRRPSAAPVFLFILTYKLGDAALGPMVKPFWLDRGLSPAEIGLISTSVGVLATVAGAMAGGFWIARLGIFRGLWVLGLLQALPHLGYAAVAQLDLPRGFIYAASILESFAAGLGTAAFLSFLMNVCDREHAAVQYALLSALFGFTRSVAGGFSGWGAEHLGYGGYFTLSFFLAFIPFAFLPWVRSWVRA